MSINNHKLSFGAWGGAAVYFLRANCLFVLGQSLIYQLAQYNHYRKKIFGNHERINKEYT